MIPDRMGKSNAGRDPAGAGIQRPAPGIQAGKTGRKNQSKPGRGKGMGSNKQEWTERAETPPGAIEENGDNIPEMLEELVGQAIMATREGRMTWGESFRPNAFRAGIGPNAGNSMDLEIMREAESGRTKLVLWNRGDLVTSFHPRAEPEARELLEHLELNAVRQDQRVRQALEQIRELRRGNGPVQESAITKREWTIRREMDAKDEEDNEVELDVRITFSEPEGKITSWDLWENALDYFLQYDDLNTFLDDTDAWHSRTDFLLTGTKFDFDLDEPSPETESPALSGKAVRYVAVESRGGDLTTLTDEENIVSQVKFRMEFDSSEETRRVLRHIRNE